MFIKYLPDFDLAKITGGFVFKHDPKIKKDVQGNDPNHGGLKNASKNN